MKKNYNYFMWLFLWGALTQGAAALAASSTSGSGFSVSSTAAKTGPAFSAHAVPFVPPPASAPRRGGGPYVPYAVPQGGAPFSRNIMPFVPPTLLAAGWVPPSQQLFATSPALHAALAEQADKASTTAAIIADNGEDHRGVDFYHYVNDSALGNTPNLHDSVGVEHVGQCNITDIHTEQLTENRTYYSRLADSRIQTDVIVIGTARMIDGTTRRVQRIMLGQLSMGFAKHTGLGIHGVGKLLAFIAGKPVTIYGMIPQEAIKNATTVNRPTMVGFWLGIDPEDGGLVRLQRACVIFCHTGFLYANTVEKLTRLLEIVDHRRSFGNTGLPESPMTCEAARKPPTRHESERQIDIFRYFPEETAPVKYFPEHEGFQPFVSRLDVQYLGELLGLPSSEQRAEEPSCTRRPVGGSLMGFPEVTCETDAAFRRLKEYKRTPEEEALCVEYFSEENPSLPW